MLIVQCLGHWNKLQTLQQIPSQNLDETWIFRARRHIIKFLSYYITKKKKKKEDLPAKSNC